MMTAASHHYVLLVWYTKEVTIWNKMRPHATISISSEQQHQQCIGIPYSCRSEAWCWRRRLQSAHKQIHNSTRATKALPHTLRSSTLHGQQYTIQLGFDNNRALHSRQWIRESFKPRTGEVDGNKRELTAITKSSLYLCSCSWMHSKTHCHCFLASFLER